MIKTMTAGRIGILNKTQGILKKNLTNILTHLEECFRDEAEFWEEFHKIAEAIVSNRAVKSVNYKQSLSVAGTANR